MATPRRHAKQSIFTLNSACHGAIGCEPCIQGPQSAPAVSVPTLGPSVLILCTPAHLSPSSLQAPDHCPQSSISRHCPLPSLGEGDFSEHLRYYTFACLFLISSHQKSSNPKELPSRCIPGLEDRLAQSRCSIGICLKDECISSLELKVTSHWPQWKHRPVTMNQAMSVECLGLQRTLHFVGKIQGREGKLSICAASTS